MATGDVTQDDALLVERARRADAAAYEVLVRRYYRAAYAVALSQLGRAMDAEDVCQEALVRALERLDDCRRPQRFAAWLLQIVRNRAHNYRDYLKLRAAAPLDDTAVAGGRTDSLREVQRGELRQRLERALGSLTELQRQVVLLHDLDGWKHSAIADLLGLSEVASRQHLFHARRLLRERLGAGALEEYVNEG